jgi:transcriptional regulator with XRE-family HTH domain
MTEKITDLDRVLGRTLRDARVEAGLSMADLGASAGISFQQIQKYERGNNRITAARLVIFAKALGTTAAALLGRAETDPLPDAAPERKRALLELTRAAAPLDTSAIAALAGVAKKMQRGGSAAP